MSLKILIGPAYNNNGIATWCFEAARSLRLAGCQVWLAYQQPAILPVDLENIGVEYISLSSHVTILQKISGRLKWWAQFFLNVSAEKQVLAYCVQKLAVAGSNPDAILVSQSNFISPGIDIPQWVVARAWPSHLTDYLAQLKLSSSNPILNRLHDSIYWYKMDNAAYRLATGVLALHQPLTNELVERKLNAHCVYPGTSCSKAAITNTVSNPIKLVTVALNLEDKRKNITWMLERIHDLQVSGIGLEMNLIGRYTENFKEHWSQRITGLNFLNSLPRSEVMEILHLSDLFVFTSNQENWGYVLVEAMSAGLAVFAPDQMPFPEIVGNPGYLYKPGNHEDFKYKLLKILHDPARLRADKLAFFERYRKLFSAKAFAHSILTAIGQNSSNSFMTEKYPDGA